MSAGSGAPELVHADWLSTMSRRDVECGGFVLGASRFRGRGSAREVPGVGPGLFMCRFSRSPPLRLSPAPRGLGKGGHSPQGWRLTLRLPEPQPCASCCARLSTRRGRRAEAAERRGKCWNTLPHLRMWPTMPAPLTPPRAVAVRVT